MKRDCACSRSNALDVAVIAVSEVAASLGDGCGGGEGAACNGVRPGAPLNRAAIRVG